MLVGNAQAKRLKPSVLPPAPRSNIVLVLLANNGCGVTRVAKACARSPNSERRDPNDGEKCGSHRRKGAGTFASARVFEPSPN